VAQQIEQIDSPYFGEEDVMAIQTGLIEEGCIDPDPDYDRNFELMGPVFLAKALDRLIDSLIAERIKLWDVRLDEFRRIGNIRKNTNMAGIGVPANSRKPTSTSRCLIALSRKPLQEWINCSLLGRANMRGLDPSSSGHDYPKTYSWLRQSGTVISQI
jgi:hypothetical protein